MSIQMIGIDHTKAEIDTRAVFSFTRRKSQEAMRYLIDQKGIDGAIILSTCNRMELWVSVEEGWNGNLYQELCVIKEVDPDLFSHCFTKHREEEAVDHLFQVASGMQSKILGEDQIITQVKDALTYARECGCADSVLEVLFRTAVTAAKEMKTKVQFPRRQISVIDQVIQELPAEKLAGSNCLVIGNGEMGKVSAKAFRDAKAHVWMTVRQYRHGQVELPEGCEGIPYEERAAYLKEADYVVSATTSPHYTITKELVEEVEQPRVFIDLAVPRDMDPEIAQVEQVSLFDIDDFCTDEESEDTQFQQAREEANRILEEHKADFYSWYEGRDLVPLIQKIREDAAEDMRKRLQKPIRQLAVAEQERDCLGDRIGGTAEKVIGKLLFELKENVDSDTFSKCIKGMEHIFDE